MRAPSIIKKTVNVKIFDSLNTTLNENLLPLKYSPLSYNFSYGKGVLQTDMGIVAAATTVLDSSNGRHALPSLPSGLTVKSLHVYKRYDFTNNVRADMLIVRASSNNYFETKLFERDTFHQITNLTAVGKDCSACYRYNGADVFLLSSDDGYLYCYDGTTATRIDNAPKMTSMCIHSERVFATVAGEQNKVWFSDDFNPQNWVVSGTGAGYINFDDEGGKVIKVVKFLNYVYVFRDFGIERLTAYGSQSDFALSKLYMSAARIYPQTIVAMGDRIVFLAEDGLHVCDGYNVTDIAEDLTAFLPVDKQNATACGLNNKYFLAIDLDYGSDNGNAILDETGIYVNDSLVVYDLSNKTFSVMRGVDIYSLCAVKIHTESSVLMSFRQAENAAKIGRYAKCGKYFDVNLPKYWSTGYTDLGYADKMKSVRKITMLSSCDLTLGVELDGNITEYEVKGGSLPYTVIVNKTGARLRIYVKTSVANITAIGAPTVSVDVV